MSSRKIFEAEIPDGTHLDRSRASDGAFRGTLRDDDNNDLVGALDLYEVDEADRDRSGEEHEDGDGLGLGGLIAMAAAAVGAGVVVASVRGSRRHRRVEHQVPIVAANADEAAGRASKRVLPPADWYEDASGHMRWWDGQQWTEHVKRPETIAPSRHAEPATIGHESLSEVSAMQGQAQVSMSSAEWRERVGLMLATRAFSEEQWRLLSSARIEDADASLLESQRDLKSLTAQQFSDRITAMLEAGSIVLPGAAPRAELGWYDDGSGSARWWDGCQWTGHVQRERVMVLANEHTSAPPGWYPDGSGRQRWWTGQQWADYWA